MNLERCTLCMESQELRKTIGGDVPWLAALLRQKVLPKRRRDVGIATRVPLTTPLVFLAELC